MKVGDRLIIKAKFELLTEWGFGWVHIEYSSEDWAIWLELRRN